MTPDGVPTLSGVLTLSFVTNLSLTLSCVLQRPCSAPRVSGWWSVTQSASPAASRLPRPPTSAARRTDRQHRQMAPAGRPASVGPACYCTTAPASRPSAVRPGNGRPQSVSTRGSGATPGDAETQQVTAETRQVTAERPQVTAETHQVTAETHQVTAETAVVPRLVTAAPVGVTVMPCLSGRYALETCEHCERRHSSATCTDLDGYSSAIYRPRRSTSPDGLSTFLLYQSGGTARLACSCSDW